MEGGSKIMARSIDERIVDMRFNNKQFQSGVKESVRSLDSLKEGLKFNNVGKGLSKLSSAASKLSFGGMANSVANISSKFSALGVVGFTVLTRLTNAAINFGTKLTKSLTVDPVLDGLSEYETKMNAIQTIQSATARKGTTIEEINETLAELNDYADQTIYNFANMTENVGRFANAGVDLNDATAAIKGLSNVAAGAGTNATRLAGAMYQASQALGPGGSFRAIDWFSLEQANLTGPIVQDTLREVSAEMGTVIDSSVRMKDTLKDGWLTTEVFIEGMKRLSEDKTLLAAAMNVTTFTKLIGVMKETLGSGWANTWEAILGGKEQSTLLWTNLALAFGEVVGGSADARNAMFQFWNDQGGRKDVLTGIANILFYISEVLAPIEQAFTSVFKPLTGADLVGFSKAFRELTAGFLLGAENAERIKRTFTGLFSVVSIGFKIIGFLGKVLWEFVKLLIPMKGSLLSVTATIGDFFTNLNKGTFSIDSLGNGLAILMDILKPVAKVFKDALYLVGGAAAYLISLIDFAVVANEFAYLKNKVVEFGKSMANEFTYLANKVNIEGIKSGLISVKNVLQPIGTLGTWVMGVFSKLGNAIYNAMGGIQDGISPLAKVGNIIIIVFTKIGQAIGFVFNKIAGFIGSLGGGIKGIGSGISEGVGGFLTGILDAFANFDLSSIEKLLKGSLLASIILVMRTFINSLSGLFDGFSGLGKAFIDSLEAVQETLKAYQQSLKANILIKIAIAIGILTISLIALTKIDSAKLQKALLAMGALIGGLIGAFYAFDKISDDSEDLPKLALGLIGIAASVLILAGALALLSLIDESKMANALFVLGLLAATLVGVVNSLKGNAIVSFKAAAGFLGLAIAITALTIPLFILSRIDFVKMISGLVGLAGIAGVLAGFLKLADKLQGISIKTSIALVIFSLAISRLTGVVGSLGRLDPQDLAQGVLGLAAMLGAIIVFMAAIDKLKGTEGAALVILSISSSILIMSFALIKISELTWEELGRGLAGMGIALGLLVGTMKLMKVTDIGSAASLLIIVLSMLVIATIIEDLATLTWQQILQGLGVMAAALLILVGVMKIMKPTDLASAGALFIMVTAMMMVGNLLRDLGSLQWPEILKGLVVMAATLAILAGAMFLMQSGAVGALSLIVVVAALTLLVPALLLLSTIPLAGALTGLLLLAGVFTILGVSAYLLGPLLPIIFGLAGAIALIGLAIGLAGGGIFLLALGLTTLAAAFYASGVSIGLVIEELLPLIPLMVKSLGEGFIEGIVQFRNSLPELGKALVAAIKMIVDIIVDTGVLIIYAILDLIVKLLKALAEKLPEIIDAGVDIIIALIKGISENIEELVTLGIDIVLNFIKGLESKIDEVIQAGVDFIVKFLNGTADGIRENEEIMTKAFLNVIAAMLGLSEEELEVYIGQFVQLGKDLLAGIIKGLSSGKDLVANEMEYVGNTIVNAARSVFEWNSPSLLFQRLGKALMDGMGIGVDQNADVPVKAVTKASNKVVGANKQVVKDAAKTAKNAFDKSVAWINERKYYNLLSLEEEFEEWKKLQGEYASGSDERKEIERQMYRLINELGAKEFDDSKKWIDKKKDYNEQSLNQELASWKRVQKKYKDGQKKHVSAIKEREEADLKVYKLEQQIADLNEDTRNKIETEQSKATASKIKLEEDYYAKSKEINDKLRGDIDSLMADYESAVKSRTDTLYTAYGLFDKVELNDAVKGSDLIDNLEGQVQAMETWREQLNLLKARGVNVELVEELQELGPDSVQEIRALNKLGAGELDKYVQLWAIKHKDAKDRATYELSDLRGETSSQIELLTRDSKKQLETFSATWVIEFSKLAKASKLSILELRKEWLDAMGGTQTEADKATLQLIDSAIAILNDEDWSNLNVDMLSGLMFGATTESESLAKIGRVARAALATVDKEVQNGRNKDGLLTGLVEGVKTYGKSALTELTEVETVAKDGLNKVFATLGDLLSWDLNITPTITPVLDLTNVNTELDNAFGASRNINTDSVLVSAERANTIAEGRRVRENSIVPTSSGNNEVNITNNYTVRDDSDVRKISLDFRTILDRYSNAKGVALT